MVRHQDSNSAALRAEVTTSCATCTRSVHLAALPVDASAGASQTSGPVRCHEQQQIACCCLGTLIHALAMMHRLSALPSTLCWSAFPGFCTTLHIVHLISAKGMPDAPCFFMPHWQLDSHLQRKAVMPAQLVR